MGGKPFIGGAAEEDPADRPQHLLDVGEELVVQNEPVEL